MWDYQGLWSQYGKCCFSPLWYNFSLQTDNSCLLVADQHNWWNLMTKACPLSIASLGCKDSERCYPRNLGQQLWVMYVCMFSGDVTECIGLRTLCPFWPVVLRSQWESDLVYSNSSWRQLNHVRLILQMFTSLRYPWRSAWTFLLWVWSWLLSVCPLTEYFHKRSPQVCL